MSKQQQRKTEQRAAFYVDGRHTATRPGDRAATRPATRTARRTSR